MKNLIYLTLSFLLITNLISAQINSQTDSISGMSDFNLHFEASSFIVVSLASINVEGKLFSSDSQKFHLYGRAGFGYADVANRILCTGRSAVGGILGFTMLAGKDDHHFEAHVGTYLGSFKNKDREGILNSPCREKSGSRVIPLIDLGYRYQKPGSGFIFRARVGTYGVGIGFGAAF